MKREWLENLLAAFQRTPAPRSTSLWEGDHAGAGWGGSLTHSFSRVPQVAFY